MPKEKNATREKLLDITFEEIYIHGYAATSIGTILKKANTPKGSMYHFFDSKKSLVLAMIDERLGPKMDQFFNYTKHDDLSVTASLKQTFTAMAKNDMLVQNGCPLYRLMVELSPVDKEFDTILNSKYRKMKQRLGNLLQTGIDIHEFTTELHPDELSDFILSSVWGVLSMPPSVSSRKNFITHIRHILSLLEQYRID